MATRDLRSYSSLKARENNKEAQSLKNTLSSLRQFLATENPLKMI